ncbi:hypothetical protein QLQ12_00930 [Actinoplanes sp. NEAU-A12]|uniref:Uncharacterized protein n=1 Tax=Actinoplanes sandaracinus TaxID=3045177 RepID=A0ABT6WBW1_9ACTN|nr:hypothetical protein [Actinoplanes sandaracinus]MDI6097172.1 hypothetical protein [Actinoplanes sandaracinus]
MAETVTDLPDLAVPAHLSGQAYESAVRQKARRLKDELIRQTLEDLASWRKAVDDKWAQAHPDLAPIFPISEAEIEQYRQRVRHEDYEWIVPAFDSFLDPDPGRFDPIIDTLAGVEAMFGGDADASGSWVGSEPALVRINDVREEMGNWQGDFRDAFIDEFVTPLQNTFPNHRELARLARAEVKMARLIYLRRRKSVLTLLDQSLAATQALGKGSFSGNEAFKWGSIILVVAGTVAGAFAPGVGILASALIMETVGTVGQGFLDDPPDEEKLPLAGATATEVAINVNTAMGKLNADVALSESKAAAAFHSQQQLLEQIRKRARVANGPSAFSVAAPALSTATPAQIIRGLRPN